MSKFELKPNGPNFKVIADGIELGDLIFFKPKRSNEKNEENKLENKIWQKRSNIVPTDLDERIEKYHNSKKEKID